MMTISEINITPVRPRNGLVAFASCVINGCLYCGSIGVHVQPNGRFRLVYPSRKVGGWEMGVFHPINRCAGKIIEAAITAKCDELFGEKREENVEYDGHSKNYHRL